MPTDLVLKPISDLLAEKTFFIPAYQRGYRWTERQVTELLDDVWEFLALADAGKSAFYCLQPIVVKRRAIGGGWELVDGQQRLTTIHLVLTYLRNLMAALGQSSFELAFETRKGSEAFLRDIDLKRADENIDYHHICRAYATIDAWFKSRPPAHQMRMLQAFLNDDTVGKNVKVIWYELDRDDAAIHAFTRLNVGKIPLTNSELVRALFLRTGNFQGRESLHQLRIAQEWDGIEKVLQSDTFWFYMHAGENTPHNRIEVLFDLHAARRGRPSDPADPYSTFHFFNEQFQQAGHSAEDEWLQVKQSFMTLEEWFNDRVLYHLVGFLINEGEGVQQLLELAQGAAKSAFQARLRILIAHKLGIRIEMLDSQATHSAIQEHLADLDYERDRRKIRAVLLLFNIATLLANPTSNLRFPFDAFKKQRWDIEHVKSVASKRPGKSDAQRLWLQGAANYFAGDPEAAELHERIVGLSAETNIAATSFDPLYDEILQHVGEIPDAEVDNSVGNLTLLDQRTNRAYGNAIFPVKRSWILGLDEEGTFVPLCTRNVFLKCYSRHIGNMMFWQPADARNYEAEIGRVLTNFFTGAEGMR